MSHKDGLWFLVGQSLPKVWSCDQTANLLLWRRPPLAAVPQPTLYLEYFLCVLLIFKLNHIHLWCLLSIPPTTVYVCVCVKSHTLSLCCCNAVQHAHKRNVFSLHWKPLHDCTPLPQVQQVICMKCQTHKDRKCPQVQSEAWRTSSEPLSRFSKLYIRQYKGASTDSYLQIPSGDPNPPTAQVWPSVCPHSHVGVGQTTPTKCRC